jgi:hypothetical protein
MIVSEMGLLKRLINLMEKFSSVKTYDSILKKKVLLKIKMERKLKYHKKKYQLLEGSFLDWEMFSLMMHSDQHIVLTLQ